MTAVAVTRVLAPNPGLFTGPGTNSYVVAAGGDAVVVDPGPVIDAHLLALHEALAGLTPKAVLVTHTHPDHAPAANRLAAELGVPAVGFGPGPEFDPDQRLGDGDAVAFGPARAVAVATPGHTADHLCYLVGDLLFTGDHIMGGSTVVIEDLRAYLDSLRKLLDIELARLHPGHGPDVEDAHRLVRSYLAHRQERERQVLAALAGGAATVGEVVEVVYADVDRALHPIAAHTVAAHLGKLSAEGRVSFAGAAEWGTRAALIEARLTGPSRDPEEKAN